MIVYWGCKCSNALWTVWLVRSWLVLHHGRSCLAKKKKTFGTYCCGARTIFKCETLIETSLTGISMTLYTGTLTGTNLSSVTSTTVVTRYSITCSCHKSSCAQIPITSATCSICRCSTITWWTRLSLKRSATISSRITVRRWISYPGTWLMSHLGQIVASIKMYPKEYFNQANTVQEVKALRAETTESPKKKKNKSPHYVVKSPQTPAPKH